MICVFDIETIPDFHLLSEVYGFSGSPLEVARAAFSAQKEKSGSEFLPPSFHRVISIASVIADEYGRFVRVGHFGAKFLESKKADLEADLSSESTESAENLKSPKISESSASAGSTQSLGDKTANKAADKSDKKATNAPDSEILESAHSLLSKDFLDALEAQILGEFWSYVNRNCPKLVSFNGRGFDLPVLTLRAMRYDISAHGFFESDNLAQNKTKWENYRSRYSESFHADLYECLGHFGATRALNLNSVCQMLDLVGKYDMSGEDVYLTLLGAPDSVAGQFSALETINSYCHSDVLNTYWLYLKYMLLRGDLRVEDYAQILDGFGRELPKDRPYSEVFSAKIAAHLARYTTQYD